MAHNNGGEIGLVRKRAPDDFLTDERCRRLTRTQSDSADSGHVDDYIDRLRSQNVYGLEALALLGIWHGEFQDDEGEIRIPPSIAEQVPDLDFMMEEFFPLDPVALAAYLDELEEGHKFQVSPPYRHIVDRARNIRRAMRFAIEEAHSYFGELDRPESNLEV